MPLLHVCRTPLMGIWEITETWQEMLHLFACKDVYAEELGRIPSEKRKQEWLAVRLLLKRLTGAEMTVGYHENGAPFLINSPYHVSISHTKGYAAVILNKDASPGIDIEYRSERAWKLRQRFMSETELNLLALSDNDQPAAGQLTCATLCWCAKETAFKALHEPEVDFIKHLHISPFTLSGKGVFLLTETKTPHPKTCLIHYQITENFVISFVVEI